jgi:hypothetical protein
MFSFLKKINSIYIIAIVYIILSALYSYTTYFTKTITIQDKESLRNGSYGQNVVSDTEGNIYTIDNTIFYGFYTSTELYTRLDENKKYQITGYGYRVPILNWFPSILSAQLI